MTDLLENEQQEADLLEAHVEKQLEEYYDPKHPNRVLLIDMGCGPKKIRNYVIKRFTGWQVGVNKPRSSLYPFYIQ